MWCFQAHDKNIAEFADDARKFIAMFGVPIIQSAPHIYLSALPFAPSGSKVSRQYVDKFPNLITVKVGRKTDWPVTLGVFEGHIGIVTSIAFSPDGKQIASGSWDKTIRVWDAQTGQVVSGPFEGHTDYVTSVAFSPDGKQIASGSWDKTIRVWDAQTGQVVSGPFEGHTSYVICVAFSSNGVPL